MKNIWYALFIVICITVAYAQDDDTIRYYQAYRTCNTRSQNNALSECNYAKAVEKYYITCMSQNGYSDFKEVIPKNQYPDYLKTYKKCTSIANNAAQEQCNYGLLYKKHYDACMLGYGFNSEGEPLEKPTKRYSDTEESPKNTQKPDKNGSITRFLESIL